MPPSMARLSTRLSVRAGTSPPSLGKGLVGQEDALGVVGGGAAVQQLPGLAVGVDRVGADQARVEEVEALVASASSSGRPDRSTSTVWPWWIASCGGPTLISTGIDRVSGRAGSRARPRSCSSAGQWAAARPGRRARDGCRNCCNAPRCAACRSRGPRTTATASGRIGCEEARPAGAALELGCRVEQRLAAAGALIHAAPLLGVQRAGAGALRAVRTHDLVLLRRQLAAAIRRRSAWKAKVSCEPDFTANMDMARFSACWRLI